MTALAVLAASAVATAPPAAAHGGELLAIACGPMFLALAPDGSPCVSRASNDHTAEIMAHGEFNPHTGQAALVGHLVHKDENGAVVGASPFTSTRLLSYTTYGTLPPPMEALEGGLAVFEVRITAGFDAILEIDCVIGSPPAGATEGVRLIVDGGPAFDESESGLTVFVRAV